MASQAIILTARVLPASDLRVWYRRWHGRIVRRKFLREQFRFNLYGDGVAGHHSGRFFDAHADGVGARVSPTRGSSSRDEGETETSGRLAGGVIIYEGGLGTGCATVLGPWCKVLSGIDVTVDAPTGSRRPLLPLVPPGEKGVNRPRPRQKQSFAVGHRSRTSQRHRSRTSQQDIAATSQPEPQRSFSAGFEGDQMDQGAAA